MSSAEPEVNTTRTYRVDNGRYHSYYLDGVKVPGVTTLISGGVPKNLTKWAGEQVANHAVDNWGRLSKLPISVRLKELSGAPFASRDRAAVRGSRIHALAEKLLAGEPITVPEDIALQVKGCADFLRDWGIKAVATESAVFSRKHQYGGTFDLIADCSDSKRRMLDWKSNKSGVWGEASLQLAGYRYSDFMLDEDEKEIPIPDVDECVVVWLPPDGGYQVVPMTVTRTVYKQFLAAKVIAEAVPDIREYAGAPLEKPVTLG